MIFRRILILIPGLVLFLFFVFRPTDAHALTRTIADGGGNYNSTSTWVEGAIPTSADDVVATATSGQLTVNVTSAAKSVNFTNYTNTLTMNALLTVSGNVTLVPAMTIAGTAALTVNAAATLTSNGTTWPNALNLTTGNIIYTLADNWTVLDTFTVGSANLTVTMNGSTLFLGSNLSVIGTFANGIVAGTTDIVLNGTGTWSNNTGVTRLTNNLTIDTLGVITISGTVHYHTGTLTYTAGTVVTSGSTLTVLATTTLDTDGIVWNNLTFPSSGTITLTSDVTIDGTLSAGGTNVPLVMNGFTIFVGGNLTVTGSGGNALVSGTTNIVLNGTGNWSNTLTTPLRNNLTIDTSGTITVTGTVYYNTGALTYVTGTVVTTGSTLTSAGSTTLNTSGISWDNISMSGSNAVFTLSSDMTASGNLILIGSNNVAITINGNALFVGGGILQSVGNASSRVTGTTNIVLNGTGTWSNSSSSVLQNNLTINTLGTITVSGAVGYNTGTLTYTSGTVTTTGSTLEIALATTLNTDGMSWENVRFSGGNITVTLSSNLALTGTLIANNTNTTTTVNGFTIFVAGGLSIGPTAASSIGGTALIVLNGTGTWSQGNASASLRSNLTINTAGTITISGTVVYHTGALTYIAGTVVTTGSTLNITASTTLDTNGINWSSVTFAGVNTKSLVSNLTINGILTVSGTTTLPGPGGLVLGTNSTWAGASAITLGGSLTLGTAMTRTYTGAITFNATSGTKIITSNGALLASNITFNGVGGTWLLADALTTGSANSITLTNGTLNANEFNVTAGLFASSNSNTRAIVMGSGTWTITGNNAIIWTTATSTGLTLTRGNPVVLSYSGGTGTRTISSSTTEAVSPDIQVSAGTDSLTMSGGFNNLDFYGFTGILNNSSRTVYGDLTLSASMTLTAGTIPTVLGATSGTKTITSDGNTIDFPLTFDGVGGTFNLNDALTLGDTRTLTLTNGTVEVSKFDVTAGKFASTNTNTRALSMGPGIWTLTGTGTVWDVSASTGFDLTPGSSTIVISDSSATAKTFAGGDLVYNDIWFTGSGTGSFILTGSNTFSDFKADTPPHTILFTSDTNTTVSTFTVAGASGSFITINSTASGSFHTLTKSGGGTVNSSYLVLQDSHAEPNSTWFAGAGSVDNGGNFQWFSHPVVATPTPTATITPFPGGGGSGGAAESNILPPYVSPTPTEYFPPSGYPLGTIRAVGDIDVYTINESGYKRLFLNPTIFSFYGYLGGFIKVKVVTTATRDEFLTSSFLRNCQSNGLEVYSIQVVGEDVGILHHVALTGGQAVAEDPNFFKKVFCISAEEFNWYSLSLAPYTSLGEVQVYSR